MIRLLVLSTAISALALSPVLAGENISTHSFHFSDAPGAEQEVELEAVPVELLQSPSEMVEVIEEPSHCRPKICRGVCKDPGHPKKPLIDKPGDRNRGDCPPLRYRMPDCKRAGNPHCVAWWAKCGVDGKYGAWFVGGGSPFPRGRCRKLSEGTWGLDYKGLFGHSRVWLNYTRHDRKQGGEGAYETDGEPEFVKKAHSFLGLGH